MACWLIVATLLAPVLPALGRSRHVPLPPAYDGSMMPYDFSVCTQIPWLPDSLTPVYAGYVARHGARYLSSPKKIDPLYERLQRDRSRNRLNDHGERFMDLLDTIRAVNEGNWGDLSPVGVAEEKKLADRMHRAIAALSERGNRVNAISSYVPRVVMTMYQFTGRLVGLNDRLRTMTDEGAQYDSLVRCFAWDRAYADFRKDGDWKGVYDDFVRRNVPAGPAERLFRHSDLKGDEARSITMDMYEVLKGNRAAGIDPPTTEWMSEAEYRQCWRASNLAHYLRNSISPLSDLAGRATAPLMRDIIAKADSALAAGYLRSDRMPQPTVNAWFGHAETLLPLLSLMRLPGCFDMPLDYDTLDDCWRIQDITPLGANILILIARAPSGRDYACVQLNGRTVSPLPGHPDIVTWQALKTYWQQRLQAFKDER